MENRLQREHEVQTCVADVHQWNQKILGLWRQRLYEDFFFPVGMTAKEAAVMVPGDFGPANEFNYFITGYLQKHSKMQ